MVTSLVLNPHLRQTSSKNNIISRILRCLLCRHFLHQNALKQATGLGQIRRFESRPQFLDPGIMLAGSWSVSGKTFAKIQLTLCFMHSTWDGRQTEGYRLVPKKTPAVSICLSSPTFSRIGEDLFGDVELVLCCSGPVLHPSPALHGEVDIAGNCWHRLSLDGYHWTSKRNQKQLRLSAAQNGGRG